MPAVRFAIRVLTITLLYTCLALPAAKAQSVDSTGTDVSVLRLPTNHSPQRALFQSLVVPGWGQMHNRQYWKLPFVYAGLGGMTWLSIKASQNHKLYTRAFQYKAWQDIVDAEGIEHPFPQFEDEHLRVLELEGCTGSCTASANQLKQIRDNFRRNRDLSRFGIGLVYGLSVIDAFVSAHLLDFDVSEDLTVQLLPHPNGATASLRIGF